jgi:hypothetical protein
VSCVRRQLAADYRPTGALVYAFQSLAIASAMALAVSIVSNLLGVELRGLHLVRFLLMAAAGIAFCVWMVRTNRNARALDASPHYGPDAWECYRTAESENVGLLPGSHRALKRLYVASLLWCAVAAGLATARVSTFALGGFLAAAMASVAVVRLTHRAQERRAGSARPARAEAGEAEAREIPRLRPSP